MDIVRDRVGPVVRFAIKVVVPAFVYAIHRSGSAAITLQRGWAIIERRPMCAALE